MSKEPFVIERTLNAPIERVWQAITDKNKMKEWYFNLSDFRPEVGFEFSFPGQGSKGENYTHLCKIVEVIPGKKIKHSWAYQDFEGESFVSWELFDEGDKTRVKLTHEGLETFPQNNPDFAKESFSAGWTELVGKLLKDFVEA